MELELRREELEYQIAIEKKESETVKAKELLDIQLMQNELDKLYAEKDAAKLYTDVAGTVSQVMTLSPGDWVNAGEVVATVIDITDLYIKINPDDDVSEFMVGRPITIRYEGEYFDGTIVESTISKIWDRFDSFDRNYASAEDYRMALREEARMDCEYAGRLGKL